MSDGVLPIVGAVLTLAGALFFLVAGLGLLRLPDLYCRLHAPTKAASLGLLLCALGSMLSSRGASAGFELEKLLLVLFVLLTAPVSAQLLARGAIARGVATAPGTQGRPLSGPIERVDGAEPTLRDGG
jgi:multicomponent K+:H+ antiporter subunit G